jgi:hypothetical protein
MKTFRYERKIRVEVLYLLAQQITGDRGIVVDEETAFAIKDFSARRKDGYLPNAVRLG